MEVTLSSVFRLRHLLTQKTSQFPLCLTESAEGTWLAFSKDEDRCPLP